MEHFLLALNGCWSGKLFRFGFFERHDEYACVVNFLRNFYEGFSEKMGYDGVESGVMHSVP